jgi:hypothetical protein
MQLREFQTLIENMPLSYQSFTSKRSTWAPEIDRIHVVGDALRSIFGKLGKVTLSRSDIRDLANKPGLEEFVIATIIWGYPSGPRGNHFAKFSAQANHLVSLTQLLSTVRRNPITQWKQHYSEVKRIVGIGLSTYTKFLNFLSVRVQGHTALILDEQIIRVLNQGIFEELSPLHGLGLRYDNAYRFYPQYLECMHSVANTISVSAEKIEFFLFEFGQNLKAPII